MNKVSNHVMEAIAGRMMAKNGPDALTEAIDQLNKCIDRGDWHGRDTGAGVVRLTFGYKETSAEPKGVASDRRLP